tara:strand:+ start:304 stop:1131 length:828 start_codon:yes stop_codon:yes gene_type:complete
MANRVPLVVTNQKLREIANGDTLDIRGNRLKLDSSAIELGSIILRDSGGTLGAFTAADSTVAASIAGGLANIVDDTSPQLGGNLDLNSRNITGTGDINTTGSLTISGNLTVNGTTTTINSTTLTVDDKNIVLSSGGNAAAASGAGITIDGVSATMLYNTTSHRFDFNRGITSTDSSVFGGNGSASGVTVDDGSVVIRTGTGSVAYIDLYCEVSNAHRVRVQSPAHSQYGGNITVKLPNVSGTVATVGTATADVLLIKDSGGSTVKTIKGAGNSAL